MTTRTPAKWAEILRACGVRVTTATRWGAVFADVVRDGTFSIGDAELDDFLGQVLHESQMLERLEENLTYTTPERLCAVWPARFRTGAQASPYVRNPRGLANKVYGGRLGNSGADDGWLYRGSGLIQCTGRDNFAMVGDAIGVDLVKDPDRLRNDPAVALRASIAWWESRIPDSAMGDVRRITKLVNGGTHGLDDRGRLAALAAKAINA